MLMVPFYYSTLGPVFKINLPTTVSIKLDENKTKPNIY